MKFQRLLSYFFLTFLLTTGVPVAFAAGTVGTGTAASCNEAAFDAALAGWGMVTFDCGPAPVTITFTTTKFIDGNTNLNGGAGLVTLSGGNAVQLFNVSTGVHFTASSLTISDGFCGAPDNGGAVHLNGPGTVGTFTNIGFYSNNCVNNGGALFAADSDVTVTDSTFSGNSSTAGAAGALMLLNSNGIINGTVFTNNSGFNDPAVLSVVGASTIDIQNSLFNLNSYIGAGIGRLVEIQPGSTGSIARVHFYQNTTGVSGIITNSGDLTIDRSSFHDNSGVQIENADGNLTIINSTIGNNDVNGEIAAINAVGTGTTNIIFSTIANNTNGFFSNAVGESGAATVNFTNTIVGDNGASNCYGDGLVSLGGNIDFGNSCNFIHVTDQVNTDPLLLALTTANHLDFPAITTAVFNPDPASPAIDAANGGPLIDQIGTVRPVDGDGDSISAPDSGAVEFFGDVTPPVIAEVTPVPTPGTNTAPSYTFSSTEAGTITYGGDCSSATTVAAAGNTTVVFNALAVGIHNNCTITVTDASLNVSSLLNVSAFEITAPGPVVPPVTGGGGGGCAICFPQPGSTPSPAPAPIPAPSPAPTPSPQTALDFFTDISGHWAEMYINNLHMNCGVEGYEDASGNPLHLFQPDNRITRAELITMLIKCKEGELPAVTGTSFSDVASDHWAAPYIQRAYDLDIVDGFGDGTFKPSRPATRAEALKMILLTWISAPTVASALVNNLCTDIDQSSWYADYFNYALHENIVSGYKDVNGNPTDLCGPENEVLRSEAAKMIDLTS